MRVSLMIERAEEACLRCVENENGNENENASRKRYERKLQGKKKGKAATREFTNRLISFLTLPNVCMIFSNV